MLYAVHNSETCIARRHVVHGDVRVHEWIRAEAAAGKPLNLHAVARRCPKFLKAAYSGRSPRGWYRTLVDAGVDPYRVVHEHVEKVDCPVCEYSGLVLGSHLSIRHGIERHEYAKVLGPNIETSSESFRAGQFNAYPMYGIKHWERLWSKRYVIDWILRLNEGGHPLNYRAITQNGKPLTYAAHRFFESWDDALEAAGIAPADQRLIAERREWTPQLVIRGLRELAKKRRRNKHVQMSDGLRNAVTRFYGNPKTAVKAAGISYDEINSRVIFSSSKVSRLVEAIRKLEGVKGRARLTRLKAIWQKDEDNWRIVRGHYKSLRQLAIQEGIDLRVVSDSIYRDEADVQHDLDLIERSGKPITYQTLKHGNSRLYNVILKTGWGLERLVGGRSTK